jgi:hypothetical protein
MADATSTNATRRLKGCEAITSQHNASHNSTMQLSLKMSCPLSFMLHNFFVPADEQRECKVNKFFQLLVLRVAA